MPTDVQLSRNPGARQRQGESWRPLLDGAQRDRALQTVQDIADSLCEPLSLPGRTDFSLAGGTMGLAIFFAYLSQARSEKAAAARGFLEDAIAAALDGPTQASLYGGLAGAWPLIQPT